MTSKAHDGSVTFPAVCALAAAAMVVSTLLVAGSGGGGGSSGGGGGSSNGSAPPPAPPPPQQNLQAAQAPSLPINVGSTTLTATDSTGNTWTATYSSAPGAPSEQANTNVVVLTLSKGGNYNITTYYLPNPYSPFRVIWNIQGISVPWYIRITGYNPLPSTLTVGGQGVPASGALQVGSAMGTYSQTYDVTANSPASIFLSINTIASLNV